MSTPTKPKIDSHNNYCRFCGTSLTQTEQECPLKIYFCLREDKKVRSLFWRSGGSIGLNCFITIPKLIERVCRSCGPKIRNAAELYNFIEKAVSAKAEEDLNREAGSEDQTKRALPMAV